MQSNDKTVLKSGKHISTRFEMSWMDSKEEILHSSEAGESREGGDSWSLSPEETWAGSVLRWNLPHWHLPEPKPHSGSLESRVEWQHFLHPFRIPQYGKHLDLLKEKEVIHWLHFFLVVFCVNASFVKETFYLQKNWKQEGMILDCVVSGLNSSLSWICKINYIKNVYGISQTTSVSLCVLQLLSGWCGSVPE